MATISTSGIEAGRIIRSAHVLRIIEALDGTETNDILISGSLISTGSVGITGSMDVVGNITGSAFTGSFAGDGTNLTGVTGEWDGTHNGNADITGSFNVSGSTGLTGSLDVSGSVVLSGSFSGSYEGDGTNLTGITAEWDGSHNGNADITGSFNVSGSTGLTGSLDIAKEDPTAVALKVSGSVIVSGSNSNYMRLTVPVQIDNPTSTIKASTVSGSMSGSFQGDGSALTGITGEWDGSRDGNAQITGSFEVSGSSTFSGSVDVSGSVTADNVFTHDVEARNGQLNLKYLDTFGFRFSLDSSPSIISLGNGIGFGSPVTASFPISSSTINALNVSSSFSGSFQGDGSALTGITGEWDGTRDGNAEITGSFNVSGSTGLTGSLDVSGSVVLSGSFSGSFEGDGSALTGVTSEWDGTRVGNAEITGSFNVLGDTGLTGSLVITGSNQSIKLGDFDQDYRDNAEYTDKTIYLQGQSTTPSINLRRNAPPTDSNLGGVQFLSHVNSALYNKAAIYAKNLSGSQAHDGALEFYTIADGVGNSFSNPDIRLISGSEIQLKRNTQLTGSYNVLGNSGLTGSLFISGSTNTSGSVSISGSLSAGRNNDTISGSIALGTGNNLTGSDAIAIGTNNHASESADGAIMIGVLNDADANANDSIAIGRNNNMGSGGIAMGFYNEVKLGSNRVLVGNHLTSSNSGNDPYLLIGQYNEVSGVEDGFFAIGGGTSTSNRKNALVISSSADHTVHKFEDVIQLNQIHPLPNNVPTGSIATSGSAGSVKPFFWDGTNWNALY